MKKVIGIVGIVLLLVIVFFVLISNKKSIVEEVQVQENQEVVRGEDEVRVPSKYACVGEYCDGSMDSDNLNERTVLQIPLVKDGGTVGCGVGVFYAPHAVPKTVGVLDATYRLLFDIKAEPEIKEDGFRNTIALYQKLFYDRVTIDNGTAKVYLSGSMYGPGHCSLPEIREQINRAAFYFDTVNTVEVYFNGTLFDWCSQSSADPSEDGCDTTPKYWRDTK